MENPIDATVEGWTQDLPDTANVQMRIAEGIKNDILASHFLDIGDALRRAALLGMAYHDLKEKYL